MKKENKVASILTLVTFIAVALALSMGHKMLLETRSVVDQYLKP